MADAVMPRMVLLAVALTLGGVAMAETLPDPTRPHGAGIPGGEDGPIGSGYRLQSILHREGMRPRALINGEWVEQGKKIGDRRVAKIGKETVILRGPGGKETLGLTPGVSKTPVATSTSGKK